ncbi:hypothetical protein ACP4OV_010309 [Aristida adscensionis]
MGDKMTLRMAREELEDLYLGVPDDSVDLTFKDLAFTAPAAALPSPSPAAPTATAVLDDDERKTKKTAAAGLARSSTNIFTYRPLVDEHDGDGPAGAGPGPPGLLQLSPSPSAAAAPPPHRHPAHHDDDGGGGDPYLQLDAADAAPGATSTARISRHAVDVEAGGGGRRSRRSHVAAAAAAGGGGGGGASSHDERRAAGHSSHYRRPGIPHSNICAVCNTYIYVFRHRCLVCGRVYCRRCVSGGMGDMTEGRKCIDCLGRRFSHRYIRRAGDTGCGLCGFWGYYPNAKAVTAQELIWAEKGPAPRRRPRPPAAASSSASYATGAGSGYYSSTNTVASASMSMTSMNSDSNMTTIVRMGKSSSGMPASASSSFVASSFPHNPHALPL